MALDLFMRRKYLDPARGTGMARRRCTYVFWSRTEIVGSIEKYSKAKNREARTVLDLRRWFTYQQTSYKISEGRICETQEAYGGVCLDRLMKFDEISTSVQ
jgi:hypothetical protein